MFRPFSKRSNEIQRYSADDVVAMLGLSLHPEGGYYREMFRDTRTMENGRNLSSAIYFLLAKDKPLGWHRVDGVEIWHWYGGAPLLLELFDRKEHHKMHVSGNLMEGDRPQAVIPAKCWQAAQTLGEWTLVGCTMAPGFDLADFEMAPPDWHPTQK